MENFSEDLTKVYAIEFLRRASRLSTALHYLLIYGQSGDVMPALFSVCSYLWSGRKMYRKSVASKLYDSII